jgi:hypothetical protein
MIETDQNGSLLLERIPSSQQKLHQIVTRENGDSWPTYRFLRAPSTIHELEPYDNNQGTFIAMDNGTLAFLSDRDFSPNPIVKCRKYVSLSLLDFLIEIYGDSDAAVVEMAVFFGTLQTSESVSQLVIRYCDNMNFRVTRSKRFALAFHAFSPKEIILADCLVSPALSKALATRPYVMNLVLDSSGIDFPVEGLRSRTTIFGSLSDDFVSFIL